MFEAALLRKILNHKLLRDIEHSLDISRDSFPTWDGNIGIEHAKYLDESLVLDNDHGTAVACTPFNNEEPKLGLTIGRAG